MQNKLQQAYGNVDIYLFDQLLKGVMTTVRKCWMQAAAMEETWFTFARNGYEVFEG